MNVVSQRYARALIDALPSEHAEVGLKQLRQLGDILDAEADARKLLMNPAVPPENRARFIEKLAVALGLEKAVRNLFALLVERRRLAILGEIAVAYQKLLDERTGIIRVRVTSTTPLGVSEQGQLRERLERSTGKRIIMELDEDPEIIGGLIVRIGSTVMDASLRQQLAGFGQRLLAD